MSEEKTYSVLSLSLIIAGNLIGSGLLALPICLGMVGFVPSVIALICMYFMMMYTAIIIANKVNNVKSKSFDIPSLFGVFLNAKFKWVAILANLIVLYGLLVAYLAGAAAIIVNTCGLRISNSLVIILFFFVITLVNIFGLRLVCKCNFVLMALLLVSFVYLSVSTGMHIDVSNYSYSNYIYLIVALPIVVNSFNFHNVIPVVCRNLEFDSRKVKTTIFIGISIGFVVNLVWTIVALGALHVINISYPVESIAYSFQHNLPATISLSKMFHSSTFTVMGIIFGISAISTSYLTIGTALTGFISDLRMSYTKYRNIYIDLFIAFVPPLILTLLMQNIFLKAQEFVGGFGIALLFGVLPGFILVKSSKKLSMKVLGFILIILFFIIVLLALLNDLGLITMPKV